MRKAAIIVGLFFSLMVVCGIVFKFLLLPGGNSLVFYGAGMFFLTFSPFYAVYRFRTSSNNIGKVAAGLVAFAGLSLGISYLFFLQRWPGGGLFYYFGILCSLVFIIVHLISIFIKGNSQKRFEIFDVIILVLFCSIFIDRNVHFVRTAETEKKIVEYETAFSEEKKLVKANHDFYLKLISDTNNAELFDTINILEKRTADILKYINSLRARLIAFEIGVDQNVGDTISIRFIENPNDFDFPTHYMIGDDPRNITGETKPLEARLIKYYYELIKSLPEQSQKNIKSQIRPLIPSPIYNEKIEREVSWAWYKFYHKTIIETLTNLVKLQTDILTAEKLALEQIQKSSQE